MLLLNLKRKIKWRLRLSKRNKKQSESPTPKEGPKEGPKEKLKIRLNELYRYKPELAIAKAYQDYMNYDSIAVISKRYGIPPHTLSYKSFQKYKGLSWKQERDRMEDKVLAEMVKEKREDLAKIFGLTSKLILRVLARFEHRDVPRTVEEATKLSQILMNCDKVWRLQRELPTDIVGTKELTVTELKDVIKEINELDPFMDYKVDGNEDEPVTH